MKLKERMTKTEMVFPDKLPPRHRTLAITCRKAHARTLGRLFPEMPPLPSTTAFVDALAAKVDGKAWYQVWVAMGETHTREQYTRQMWQTYLDWYDNKPTELPVVIVPIHIPSVHVRKRG